MKSNSKPKRFFALEVLFRLLSRCSLGCLFRLAKGFSFIIGHTDNRISKQTQQNIALCFPHDTPQQRKNMYQQSLIHTTCSFIEMAYLWHRPINDVLAKIDSQDVCAEYYHDTHAKIIVAPHFGCWEILNYWFVRQGAFFALYKPARSKQLDDYILRMRSQSGLQLVATNATGLRTLLKGLKKGASVIILPDQKPGQQSAKVLSRFYGHDASTGLLIKNLLSKVDCHVYMAAATRHLSKAHYCLHVKSLDKNKLILDDQKSADYLNQSIEQFIEVDEAQYQWSYRRFTDTVYLGSVHGEQY